MSQFITHPLVPPPNPEGTLNIPLLGSPNNIRDAIHFYFPTIAVGVVEDIVAISALKGKGAYYAPDPDENADMSKAYGTYLNKPLYGALTLGNTDPHVQNGNTYTGIDGNTYTFDNIVLPVCIIEMNQPTNIGKTNITGNPGTLKQYISLDDVAITISSIVMYQPDNSPVDFIQAFTNLRQAQVSIPVTNYWLNAHGVTHIVIDDYSAAQEEGKYASIAFELKCSSDIPPTEFLP